MPSQEHETPLRLLQRKPEVAVRLLQYGGVHIAPVDEVRAVSEVATDLEVRTLTCDHVALCYREGVPVSAVIVEVQRSKDAENKDERRKRRWAWPAYLANIAHKYGLPTYFVAICFKAAVAEWAKGPFALGHPGFELRPIVLGPDNFPKVTRTAGDGSMAEVAALSAMVHQKEPEYNAILSAFFAEIKVLPEEEGTRYIKYLLASVEEESLKIMEEFMAMTLEPYRGRLWQEWTAEVRAELEQVRSETDALRNEADAVRSEADALRSEKDALRRKVEARRREERTARLEQNRTLLANLDEALGLGFTEEDRRRIRQCDDLDTVNRWLEAASRGKTRDEIFGA
ncbi:hypothetical protein [Salininema proteolyticum]|uniref:Uncharacterized protein n=1 Tax=Salininema proteolyticum TaxID=1607685 RepID=A0ABV8TV34_9ACTN